ncbi:chaplin [Streptomyces sp. HPF1205]|uniref:chaplin n=1 Tax=Streptomyces sp. HPF1205 TaxID=2873262 RepID=UPI001CED5BF9|nr:chaplin [Streptomyces sp. HPF1205]
MRQILSRSMLTVAAASSILAVTGGYATADSDAQGGAADSPGVLSGNSISAPIEVPVNACGNTVDVIAAANPAFGNNCANVSHSRHSGAQAGYGTAAPQASGSEGSPLHTSSGHRPDTHTSGAQGSGTRIPAGYGADTHAQSTHAHATHAHSTHAHSTHAHAAAGTSASGPAGRGAPAARGTGVSGARGEGGAEGSPGVGSGNSLDVPVHAPVNACGNTVDVIALLNPAMGNSCANGSADSSVSAPRPTPGRPPQGPAAPPAQPPAQPPAANPGGPNMPVSVPVADQEAPPRVVPDSTPVAHEPYGGESQLAYTGMDGREVGAAGAAGVGLLIGGALLYRRAGRAMRRIR